jgi:hypothetical protein
MVKANTAAAAKPTGQTTANNVEATRTAGSMFPQALKTIKLIKAPKATRGKYL